MSSLFLLLLFLMRPADTQSTAQRTIDSIVPWLTYNSSCSSTVELRNLGDRDVVAEVQAHKSSGALMPLAGLTGLSVHLHPGEQAAYKLQMREETDGAWVLLRETIPSPQLTSVLAVGGVTVCVSDNQLRNTVRDIAWPIRNPGFSRDIIAGDDGLLALINTSDRPVTVQACYSSGTLYSVPQGDRPSLLTTLCSETVREIVPPFGTRRYPVARGGNSHFSLNTRGDAIVLQMLRPGDPGANTFKVDSSISFGEQAPPE